MVEICAPCYCNPGVLKTYHRHFVQNSKSDFCQANGIYKAFLVSLPSCPMHEQIGPLLYTLEEYRNNKGISFDLEMEPLIEIKIIPEQYTKCLLLEFQDLWFKSSDLNRKFQYFEPFSLGIQFNSESFYFKFYPRFVFFCQFDQ